jgi:AAA+ ATPase superfamily predicted ATPase
MAHIIGRQAEKATLESVARSLEPEFVAIYGRRRVGKTYLVREYFEKAICFEIVGIKNATLRDQLDNAPWKRASMRLA